MRKPIATILLAAIVFFQPYAQYANVWTPRLAPLVLPQYMQIPVQDASGDGGAAAAPQGEQLRIGHYVQVEQRPVYTGLYDYDIDNQAAVGSALRRRRVVGSQPVPSSNGRRRQAVVVDGVYDYDYTAVVTNIGGAVSNVTATLTSVNPRVEVVEGVLRFGNVGAMSAKVSDGDTFTIRRSALEPLDPDDLFWEIAYDTAPPATPTADAGSDQVVEAGATVVLDGSKSVGGAGGGPVTYRWTIVEKPEGSHATLSDPTAVRPEFRADVPGRYVVELVCSDGTGDSAPSSVEVTIGAVKPTTRAGEDQAAAVGATVALDGSGSTTLNGVPLTYAWELVEKPAGSAAELSDPAAVTPTFVVDLPGSYKFRLVASDRFMAGDPDLVEVSTMTLAPMADAGRAQRVAVGETVHLDGGGSRGLNGLPLDYAWALASKPAGSAAELHDADTARPWFVADVPGDYVAQLTVSDASPAASAPATVLVSTNDLPPVADAGEDQEVEAGVAAQLDGGASSDPQGYPLTYLWSVLAGSWDTSWTPTATTTAS
ncbi:MAG: hypothetical protein LBT74_06235 [Acidobacteriota bacterium]|jgi:hypothetical protein|nr:hypothetical protein [Acidobacteriota bacterium]